MAAQTPRIFYLLFVMSFSVVLLILSWEHLSQTISRTTFSAQPRDVVGFFEANYQIFWNKKPNSTVTTTPAATRANTKMRTTQQTNIISKPTTIAPVVETPMPLLLKKLFTQLPVWDFEEVYNQDAAPRLSTCVGSLRNSEDKSFRKVFLPNIRLFLHKDSINMSEWNRLSHFNNPFGFMEYEYDDVMTAVKLIPKPKEPLLTPRPGSGGCISCAVVGTAGILSGSKKGKEIDSHDYVFRMNGAVIKGYEEDVGNRTSVYVHTAHSITSSPHFFKKYGYKSVPADEDIIYVMIPEGLRDFNWLRSLMKGERVPSGEYRGHRPRMFYAGKFNESRFYVLHQDFLRYVKNRFLKSPHLNSTYWSLVRPTNGAFTLFLALHTCDTVSAYGFMTEDYMKYNNYYMEKIPKTHVVFYINHDYILEMKTWKKLHDSKIIKLYQRTDASTNKPTLTGSLRITT